jgi:prefoldin subunit 4
MAEEVTQEDQSHISEFAQIAETLKALRAKRKQVNEELDLLDEIAGEVMLSDDLRLVSGEALMYRMGDVFLHVSQEEHDRLVEEDMATAKIVRGDVSHRISEIEARQAELKAQLYLRFGSQIALEAGE